MTPVNLDHMTNSETQLRPHRAGGARASLALAGGGLLLAVLVTSWAVAGPLDPPAGPVAPTNKALNEIEPRIAINPTNTPSSNLGVYSIINPGSYYLTGNLTGVAGKHGIVIVATEAVTIDLNGFEIVGVGGTGDFDGIRATVFIPPSVTIRNGTIRNWAGDGVDLSTQGVPSCTLIDLRTRNNGANGIGCGPGTTIANCIADDNGGIGLATGSGCALTGCVALSNNSDGFLLGSGSTITGCTAYLNTGDGIRVNLGCTVNACTSYANTGDGIEASVGSVITNNTCRTNGFGAGNGAGIHITGEDNRVEGNNCAAADRGIDVDVAGNFIIRNSCAGNAANWDVVAGNVILVVNAAIAGAVNGNSGGTSPGSTDPNANFSY